MAPDRLRKLDLFTEVAASVLMVPDSPRILRSSASPPAEGERCATLTLNGSTHIISDANVPTTVSTNQDVVVVLRGTAPGCVH
jgi:hypothetical protein